MRRLGVSFALAACLAAGTVAGVAAAPDKGCSRGGFESFAVDWEWEFGDGVPAYGQDAWWDQTLAGFAEEGYSPSDAASLLGLASVEALYEFIVLGLRGLDRNTDGAICGKPFPEHQNGSAAFLFNAVDGNAAQP